MRDLLFVYGTLLSGQAPPPMRQVCDRCRRVGHATSGGRLYDLGPYPGATVGADGLIRGELVEVDSEATWRALDEYEVCPRPGERDGLFRRARTVATLESGEMVDCWIYVCNRDLSDAKVIESGCWRTHRGLL